MTVSETEMETDVVASDFHCGGFVVVVVVVVLSRCCLRALRGDYALRLQPDDWRRRWGCAAERVRGRNVLG